MIIRIWRPRRQIALGGIAVAALALMLAFGGTLTALAANALAGDSCNDLPNHNQLKTALAAARADSNGGFNLDMWGTVVNRDGEVCASRSPGRTAGTSGRAAA